ncbi:unnamed protein product [Urochloa humidicola]
MAGNNQGQKIAEYFTFTIRGTNQVVQASDLVPIHPNQMQASPISKEEEEARGKAVASSSQWRRIKWNDDMVKLLVSAASYIDEDMDSIRGGGRKVGKWRVISLAMNERGFPVSPQQCEDKFYDLNKRYKRVTAILGKGTACDVVEKPELLEQMNLPEKLKEEARRHLSSKHLHYEEMCSYNNWNRASLLDDPALQIALRRLAGWGPDDLKFISDDDEGEEFTDDAEQGHRGSVSQVSTIDMTRLFSQGSGGVAADKNSWGMNAILIERQLLKVKEEMLKIEKRRFKQLMAMEEEDMELKKMKLDNEKMKLENDEMELELKAKEMEMGIIPKMI